jgi:hypothetical protein
LNGKGDPLRLHYTSTLTDNNNVYGENVGKKVMDEKSIFEKPNFHTLNDNTIYDEQNHIFCTNNYLFVP